jgi:hypothetical protein
MYARTAQCVANHGDFVRSSFEYVRISFFYVVPYAVPIVSV